MAALRVSCIAPYLARNAGSTTCKSIACQVSRLMSLCSSAIRFLVHNACFSLTVNTLQKIA